VASSASTGDAFPPAGLGAGYALLVNVTGRARVRTIEAGRQLHDGQNGLARITAPLDELVRAGGFE
jgi:hypothetical protein